MVDPHRHIRNLTEDQKRFLDECEKEFAQRFTEKEREFSEFYRKEPQEPPIVENWMQGQFGRHHGRSDHYQRDRFGGGRNDYRPPGRGYNHHSRRY
ncbi:RNA guanine-N7 methyltransferase activating subunit [Phlebotomus argentipes]|uniref:RNA guanine-N7 methyltransferase activating subunit n=1 Tax=Phlebotomus argentipes TaxID=94469 RepID=UPI0028932051|nr:RNA guanine-N7 methyltransferase activating subunit [Phlebotomus argentipes]